MVNRSDSQFLTVALRLIAKKSTLKYKTLKPASIFVKVSLYIHAIVKNANNLNPFGSFTIKN